MQPVTPKNMLIWYMEGHIFLTWSKGNLIRIEIHQGFSSQQGYLCLWSLGQNYDPQTIPKMVILIKHHSSIRASIHQASTDVEQCGIFLVNFWSQIVI